MIVRNRTEARLVRDLGATYHTESVMELGFNPDIIVECTGVGVVIADSIQKVNSGGIICLTGIGAGGSLAGLLPIWPRQRSEEQCDRRERQCQ